MLSNLKKNNTDGFTIIEIMIVLAIAGLIMLIVFLAVPALQRNARNTQRKNDVARIASGATTIVSNSNGVMAGVTRVAIVKEIGTTSYYDFSVAANLVVADEVVGGSKANPNSKDIVDVETDATCNGTDAKYSLRAIAVLYAVETAGATTPVCIQQ